jgi:hypothetical protein
LSEIKKATGKGEKRKFKENRTNFRNLKRGKKGEKGFSLAIGCVKATSQIERAEYKWHSAGTGFDSE